MAAALILLLRHKILLLVAAAVFSVLGDAEGTQSNIVLVLTDDQDQVLGSMAPLVKTRKLIQEQGVSFDNMFVASPLCCPSRASILTGMYVHNHKTLNNSVNGNCASKNWQQGPEKQTFNTYLKELGYKTYYAGKYLNKYGMSATGGTQYVPPGWDSWLGLVGNSKYYNYTVSVNGKAEKHGGDYKEDYFTDVITRSAVSFLEEQSSSKQPFFIMLATPACHGPFTPAPQYNNSFNKTTAPRTQSYNKPGGKSKHWLLRSTPSPMSASSVAYSDDVFRNRWRTLLSVDDLVEQVVVTLDKHKHLSNTYIIFTSDNGYHHGQFSLPIDKRQLYEFDIRVPLLVRGPGIPSNKSLTNPVVSIDLAPTVIELAGGKAPSSMDGRSLLPLLNAKGAVEWRSDFLVEHLGEGHGSIDGCPALDPGMADCTPNCVCEDSWNNTYSCVRTLTTSRDFMFCEFRDSEAFVEFYDLNKDPAQLNNMVETADHKELLAQQKRLETLTFCSGDSCRK
ncbi:N-acetylglucosamine-6-sulfatase [Nematostella vectensis]|uniref:N-acetylglucosamine-6-sulfatase n=1 Tax=Nematostella vectensis TaxID=45351 RepID=UPI00139067BB|nr:N-acetylglucosamine-6-sulfatase [Nematostella vectensis]